MELVSGSELFVSSLLRLGIRQVFTLVGDHLNEVLHAMQQAGIGILDMRHESAVAHAADAWARMHRRPALALVTGGPGHTNALTGITTASMAGSPLIAVSGSRSSLLADRQAFQDIDQVGMVRPAVKWAAQVPDASQIPFYLGRAYAEANSGRRGVAHLTIPTDAFTKHVEAPAALPMPVDTYSPAPDPAQLERAIALLRSAERPVIIAGSGIWWSGAEDHLQAFAEAAAIPVYTITMARGAIADDHPVCMGYADPALNRAAWKAFREADLFLILGKRFDYRLALGGSRVFPPAARFIQVDIHPQELGMNRKLDVAICADVKTTIEAFRAGWGERSSSRTQWLQRVRELQAEWQQELACRAREAGERIHPAALFAALRDALPAGTLYSWDGGDFAHWGRAMLPALRSGGWLRLGPLGAIGASLPNGLALQLAHPGRPVAVFTGDGALGFYLSEFDTAVRHRLPVVVIVGNDAGWGLERELQGEMLNRDDQRKTPTGKPATVACELRPTRYDIVMKGFGGDGETIETLDALPSALDRAFSAGVPYCLNVMVRGARSPFTEWQILGKRLAGR